MNYLTPDEAVETIVDAVTQNMTDTYQAERLARKFVYDVLDYCNRENFPKALVFTAENMVTRWLEDTEDGGRAPFKSLTQNDTTYQFAVSEVSSTGDPKEEDFDRLKPKLNLYRRPKSL